MSPSFRYLDLEVWTSELGKYLFDAANIYKDSVLGKQYLILYLDDNHIRFLELEFTDKNWLHLTGVEPYKGYRPTTVFERACNNSLSGDEIKFPLKEAVRQKRTVFTPFKHFGAIISKVSTYNYKRKHFDTDMLLSIPKQAFCVGLIYDEQQKIYHSNSLLELSHAEVGEISEEGKYPKKIVGVFSKKIEDLCYSVCEQLNPELTKKQRKQIQELSKTDFKICSGDDGNYDSWTFLKEEDKEIFEKIFSNEQTQEQKSEKQKPKELEANAAAALAAKSAKCSKKTPSNPSHKQ